MMHLLTNNIFLKVPLPTYFVSSHLSTNEVNCIVDRSLEIRSWNTCTKQQITALNFNSILYGISMGEITNGYTLVDTLGLSLPLPKA